MDALACLLTVAQRLKPEQVSLLTEMATAMTVKVIQDVSPTSDIASPEFVINLANRLLIHHATNTEPLNKKSFEYAFVAASRAAGRTAALGTSGTASGIDVMVGDDRFSLKTEGAKGIKPSTIHISKFMESAGIRSFTEPQQYIHWLNIRAAPSLRSYNRLLMLRVVRSTYAGASHFIPADMLSRPHVVYQLVEIPHSLMMRMLQLEPEAFTAISTNGGTRASVRLDDGTLAFTVAFDGSDEKLTVANLRMDLCAHHATFVIPTIT